MEKLNKILLTIVLLIVAFAFYVEHKSLKEQIKDNNIIKYDTIYKKEVVDSIEYKIKTKDSVIINLQHKFKTIIYEAQNNNDSDAVKQFLELAGAE